MSGKRTIVFLVVLFACFSIGIKPAKANSCLSTGSGGSYGTAASWTNCGGTAPKNTDTIEIASGAPITMTQATTTAGVIIDSGATLTGSTFLLTDTGNYINNGTHNGSGGVTVNGASAVVGGTGATTNSGAFTISGATAPSFSSTSTLTITGSLTMSGPVTVTAGATITELGTTAISGVVTITNNGTFNASSTGGITGSVATSTWTQGANSTLNFGGSTTSLLLTGILNATTTGNTVNYNEAAVQTCKVVQYYNLTFSGTSAKTCALTANILGNLIMGGTASWAPSLAATVNGTLTVSGGSITTAGVAFTVSSTTSISAGTVTLTNSVGAKTFTGMVTLTGGTFTGASTLIVTTAGITNNGGTVSITGTDTFSTAGATLSGSSAIAIASITVTSPGTLTNSTSLAVSGTLTGTGTVTNSSTITAIGTWSNTGAFTNNGTITAATVTINTPGAITNNATTTITGNFTGTGSWTQGSNATLNVGGGTTSALAINTLNATSTGNTVNYDDAGNQTCNTTSTQYYNLTLSGTGTKTCAMTATLGNLLYSGTGSWTLAATSTVSGNLTISGTGGGITTAGIPFTVSGTTTISAGTLTLTNNVGAKTFTGMVTLNGGTLAGASTDVLTPTGITNNAGSMTFTGTDTFGSAGATLSGANTIAFGSVVVTGSVTNSATTTLSGTLTGGGSWTQGASSTVMLSDAVASIVTVSTFNAFTNNNLVDYNGAAQTCDVVGYYNLMFDGTGTKTCLATSTLGNLTYSGTGGWTLGAALSVGGTLSVVDTGSITTGAFAFSVASTTTLTNGTLSLTNSTGAKTFTGMVTLSGGNPTLSGAATSTVFDVGITNTSGTVTVTGSSTFPNSGETLSGNSSITLGYVSDGGSITNTATTTLSGILSGGGSWTQGSSSTLTLSFTGTPISVSTFDAHTNNNLVTYSGAAQTCLATTYQNLNFAGSGAKTCAVSSVLGNLSYLTTAASTWTLTTGLTVGGNMTVSSTVAATITLGGTTTIQGNLTINALNTLDVKAGSSYPLNLDGNFTNNGTFDARAGDVTLAGSSMQSLAGTMTGSSAFYDLTITNNSGMPPSDCELTQFTPSVVFLAGASSTDDYTITTGGNVGVEYNNGSSYSFVNTDWVGPSGNPIYFRNSVAGSGTWLVKVTGVQTPLAYINVSRSDAASLGGSTINASNITNRDCMNNTNWLFGASSTSPTVYSQVAYQWYQNQNSAQVGPMLAASNTPATLTATGEPFRLRMLLAADATDSVPGNDTFVLQFANLGNGADCSAPEFGYTTISSSTAIGYYTNSLVSDGSAITPTSSDPADGGRLIVEETYQSVGTFTATTTIPAGADGNWDFSLVDNGAPPETNYCFQAMFASTTPLYAYSSYPEIETFPTPNPFISDILFNGGGGDIILTPDATTSVTAAASVSDPGGAGNISYATSTIYRTSLGAGCTANNLDCYQIPSSSCVFSGGTSTVTCAAGLWYFAQSTGYPSSSFPSDSWTSAITVTNGGGYTATVTSSAANVDVLTAINVTTSSINYGTLNPNTNSGSTDQTVTVQNAGNSSTTLQVVGTAFMNGASTIATSSQHYATSSFTFGGSEQPLSDTLTTVSGFSLTDPTSTANVQGNIFWGIGVPSGIATGTYTATTTFSAVFSQ